jgi:hypothetical protein
MLLLSNWIASFILWEVLMTKMKLHSVSSPLSLNAFLDFVMISLIASFFILQFLGALLIFVIQYEIYKQLQEKQEKTENKKRIKLLGLELTLPKLILAQVLIAILILMIIV